MVLVLDTSLPALFWASCFHHPKPLPSYWLQQSSYLAAPRHAPTLSGTLAGLVPSWASFHSLIQALIHIERSPRFLYTYFWTTSFLELTFYIVMLRIEVPYSVAHALPHLIFQYMLTGYLHCARCWVNSGESNAHGFCLHGAYSLEGRGVLFLSLQHIPPSICQHRDTYTSTVQCQMLWGV